MKKGLWRVAAGLGAVALVLAVAGAGLAADPAKIKVGLMFGMTGPASPIGPVQLKGAELAIKEINAAGGVNLGGKKVPLEAVIKDDETKTDVALRRFRELAHEDKVHAVVGSTFAPIAAALNQEMKKTPMPYIAACVSPIAMFNKANLAPTTFGIHGTAYSIGYAGAAYIATQLKLKKVFFFAPAYAFGWDQKAGAIDAMKKYGLEYEYAEAPVGTADYTTYLQKIVEYKPDVVMMAHWGVDAINVLKQANELGLGKKTKIWFNWMTNVFGSGVPPEALEGVYSLMSWYWNLDGFADAEVVKQGKAFVDAYTQAYGEPPDPYAGMTYVGTKELIRGIEMAQSVEPAAIAKALTEKPDFSSMKGPGTWRKDQQPLFKYGAFVVVGKGAAERKSKWDLVKVIGAYTGSDYLPSLESEGY
jgi:branched-chain amino acid transport system substrate-binding protein